MKILMFGAGGINTLYGYALAQAGNDVTHYVRPGKKKMIEGGIKLNFLDGRANPPRQESAHYNAKIIESLSNDDGYELVIVSVRHYQLDSALPVLKDKIGNADVLIFNGNWAGFDNLEIFFHAHNTCWDFLSRAAATAGRLSTAHCWTRFGSANWTANPRRDWSGSRRCFVTQI